MYRLRWYCLVILSGGRFSELRLIYQWFVYERVGPTRRRTCCVDHNFASRDVDGVGTCEQHNGWTVDTSITTWRILWTNWLNLYAELSQCCTKQKRRMWVNLRILCPTCAAFRSLSLSPSGCESLRWGVSHTGSSSPVISILNVHWCEVQVFIHLFLCLLRFRRPYTSASRIRLMQWPSSRRWTCPYHPQTS